MHSIRITSLVCLLSALSPGQVLVERVGSTGFIQLEAESFKKLPPKQQELAYWLSQASIAVEPVIYDQLSRFGLQQKRLLEAIAAHPEGIDPAVYRKILAFTKLFWANKGNHNENTSQKFLPEFTFEELQAAAKTRGLDATSLKASFFDPEFEPLMTAKSPKGGKDIIEASANNFYSGLKLTDLAGFKEGYPLNSRLMRNAMGKLEEQVYRAGTRDGKVKPGLYAMYLGKAIGFLEKAREVAGKEQANVIAGLIRFYQTGDPADWIRFGIDWVQNNPPVDFANGFIEVYRDARGAKGTSQSFVTVTDEALTAAMRKLADNAQYFEDRAPWLPQYRKQGVKPPLVKAVEAIVETGDFHVTTVGDNLPNENEIHEKYGSKSFLFTGSSRALDAATGPTVLKEFAASPEEVAVVSKYGSDGSALLVAMHEVIGHGSGKLNPKLAKDASFYLKEYFSTLEEARADLMALWNAWDPKLKELGLVKDDGPAKAMYYDSTRVALTQLRRIPKGDTIEEDHQRGRQLIVNYVIDKTGAIARVDRGGKTFIEIRDFQKMRSGVGLLLGELMRIKAEGDYEAIRKLIDQYGVHFDTKLRDQVVDRFGKLNLPTYFTGINADLTMSATGKVEISYPRDYVQQRLRYAAMYR